MALKDARINRIVGSGRGGGILTVYDPTVATNANSIVAPAYWTIPADEDAATQRERRSCEDFVAAQEGNDGTNKTGVVIIACARAGGPVTRRVTTNAAGRLATFTA